MEVALASCARLPEPDFDQAPLVEALSAAGLRCEVLAWDEPDSSWDAARLVLLRSTWNYARHAERFLEWANAVATRSELWNPLEIVRWNVHKGYLLDLARAGVAVTPTELVRRGSTTPLKQILIARDWADVVVKPAISAASFRTLRVGSGALAKGEAHLRDLLADGDALVQQYLPSVEEYGERAVVWIEGEITHAVRKSPRFDGEAEEVSHSSVPVAPAEADLAARALAALEARVGVSPMYARIDVAPAPTGEPLLMELELIEPSLFFPQSPRALELLVAAIERRLRR